MSSYLTLSQKIWYKEGYKYQLHGDACFLTGLVGQACTEPPWIYLHNDGILEIKAGYAWDGPSGPTFDTKNFMRGSLVHDALYQLMRCRRLHISNRKAADELLFSYCRKDGMSWLRAWAALRAVRKFAAYAAAPQEPQILEAP